jgi:DNA polymerase
MVRRSTPAAQRKLDAVRDDARACRNCHLWQVGTQTVFGSGPATAGIMLVGEQPGDQEDLAGEPFVGPAGRLLREAMVEAGLDPAGAYLTNAVKHFKWTPRGQRRIHEKPNREEILACRMWLDQELAIVKPRGLVALGATAAGALLGASVRVTRDRGRLLPSPLAPLVMVTVHPSSILRAPDDASRRQSRRDFVRDLKAVAEALARSPDVSRPARRP